MLQDLKQIQNPFVRSATAGITVSSFILIASALGLGILKIKETAKIAVLGAATGGGIGAIAGAIVTPTKTKKQKPDSANLGQTGWKDWRSFVVRRKVKESEEITSFYLEPQDGGPLPGFKPGQFLTIQLNIPGQPRPVIRTYSLSDYAESPSYYRLSIKREPAPKNLDVPPGLASNFMHDQVQEGTVLPAKPPNGKFFIDLNKTTPAILISNGVGITPMISMAKACNLQGADRQVWFLHGARNGQFHALREEVNSLAGLNLHYRYSRPQPEDDGYYQSTGYIDANLIDTKVLPALEQQGATTAAEYFLCGSPPFLDGIRQGLRDLGVPEENVYFESFGPKAKSEAPKQEVSVGDSAEVVFSKSGKTVTWKPTDGTLLEFAEANDIDAASSCRAGICLTCMCPIQEGEVSYEEDPTGTPDEGSVLICISKPGTDRVVLDL